MGNQLASDKQPNTEKESLVYDAILFYKRFTPNDVISAITVSHRVNEGCQILLKHICDENVKLVHQYQIDTENRPVLEKRLTPRKLVYVSNYGSRQQTTTVDLLRFIQYHTDGNLLETK